MKKIFYLNKIVVCIRRVHRLSLVTHTHTDSIFDIPIFAKLYEFYKLLTPAITSFPKTKRYTLGQKLDNVTLGTIELIITASYLPTEQKLPLLEKASIKLDLLKILLRLAFETKSVSNNKYQELVSHLIEIGKMLGGWIKSKK